MKGQPWTHLPSLPHVARALATQRPVIVRICWRPQDSEGVLSTRPSPDPLVSLQPYSIPWCLPSTNTLSPLPRTQPVDSEIGLCPAQRKYFVSNRNLLLFFFLVRVNPLSPCVQKSPPFPRGFVCMFEAEGNHSPKMGQSRTPLCPRSSAVPWPSVALLRVSACSCFLVPSFLSLLTYTPSTNISSYSSCFSVTCMPDLSV